MTNIAGARIGVALILIGVGWIFFNQWRPLPKSPSDVMPDAKYWGGLRPFNPTNIGRRVAVITVNPSNEKYDVIVGKNGIEIGFLRHLCSNIFHTAVQPKPKCEIIMCNQAGEPSDDGCGPDHERLD